MKTPVRIVWPVAITMFSFIHVFDVWLYNLTYNTTYDHCSCCVQCSIWQVRQSKSTVVSIWNWHSTLPRPTTGHSARGRERQHSICTGGLLRIEKSVGVVCGGLAKSFDLASEFKCPKWFERFIECHGESFDVFEYQPIEFGWTRGQNQHVGFLHFGNKQCRSL